MKRAGHLIEKIADTDNLYYAFWKARKGKDGEFEVEKFRRHLEGNIFRLQRQLLGGSVSTGNYYYFTIYDPKEREICAAPFSQRVLHHAIMNVCHPYFEKAQIYDSYATRPGKGTYAALDRAKQYTRKYKWYLKLDVRKFFPSLSHQITKKQLATLFKDKKLLNIFSDIIDSYENTPGIGLPIGNLTSQYLANHYLSPADHFVKEQLKIPAYIRYMDDMILWHNTKSALQQAGKAFVQFIEQQLALTIKPSNVNPCLEGVSFLGYILYPQRVALSHRSRFRFIRKLKLYNEKLNSGDWNQYQYQNHVYPLTAFTEYANAKALRKKVIAELGQQS